MNNNKVNVINTQNSSKVVKTVTKTVVQPKVVAVNKTANKPVNQEEPKTTNEQNKIHSEYNSRELYAVSDKIDVKKLILVLVALAVIICILVFYTIPMLKDFLS